MKTQLLSEKCCFAFSTPSEGSARKLLRQIKILSAYKEGRNYTNANIFPENLLLAQVKHPLLSCFIHLHFLSDFEELQIKSKSHCKKIVEFE